MVYLNTAQKSIQKVYKISSCILLYTFVYFCILLYTFVYFCNMAQKNYTKSIPKILLVYFWYTFGMLFTQCYAVFFGGFDRFRVFRVFSPFDLEMAHNRNFSSRGSSSDGRALA